MGQGITGTIKNTLPQY